MKTEGWNREIGLEYLRWIGEGRVDRIMPLLAPDAAIEVVGRGRYVGSQDIQSYLEQIMARMPEGWKTIDIVRVVSDDSGVAIDALQSGTSLIGDTRRVRFSRYFRIENRRIREVTVFPIESIEVVAEESAAQGSAA